MARASQTSIPCTLMRGGTSKGPFFLASDLASESGLRDRVLLAAMGSPTRSRSTELPVRIRSQAKLSSYRDHRGRESMSIIFSRRFRWTVRLLTSR